MAHVNLFDDEVFDMMDAGSDTSKVDMNESTGLKGWLEQNVSKKQIVPALEFLTGALEKGKGEGGASDLMMSLPVIGKIGKGAKGLYGFAKHSAKYGSRERLFPYVLKVAEKGQPVRNVAVVEYTGKGGKKFIQPFYQSSGSSRGHGGGYENIRQNKWMPFLGRDEKGTLSGIKGWYIKGSRGLKGDLRLHKKVPHFARKGTAGEQDYWGRMRNTRLASASELIGLEYGSNKMKQAGTARTAKEVNEWLKGYGFNLEHWK